MSDDLRVQRVDHPGGVRSYLVLDIATGGVHERADRFLAGHGEGTQRTYAHHLVDHLRWLRASGYSEDRVRIEDLRRYLALCGATHSGPLGTPWRAAPLSSSALAVRAACLKGYYLDLTTREEVNAPLREGLSARRLPIGRDRDRSMLGHLTASVASNPLSHGAPPYRHPRMLPDGTAAAMLAAVRTARDRMIVTWLSDAGLRIGELCGLWFCDLHLRRDHPCGERVSAHVHVVKRINPNGAAVKRGRTASVVDGVVTGGIVRRACAALDGDPDAVEPVTGDVQDVVTRLAAAVAGRAAGRLDGVAEDGRHPGDVVERVGLPVGTALDRRRLLGLLHDHPLGQLGDLLAQAGLQRVVSARSAASAFSPFDRCVISGEPPSTSKMRVIMARVSRASISVSLASSSCGRASGPGSDPARAARCHGFIEECDLGPW